jgi:hypothetical protein
VKHGCTAGTEPLVTSASALPIPDFSHLHCPEGHDHPYPFACDMYGNEYCDHCWYRDGVATMLMPCGPDNCGLG